jgi:PAS domain S-box-containing protein
METAKDSSRNSASLDPRFGITLLAYLVALICYFAARLGGTLEILPEADWPFWPANALVVSVLLLVPRKAWPVLMAAAFSSFVIYNLQSGMTIHSIFWLTLSDALEVLTASLGLRYLFGGVFRLDSLKALAKYWLFAGVLAPSIGAIFGAVASKGDYWTSWRISFFSEAIAYFTILPAILGWIDRVRSKLPESRFYYVEATAVFVTITYLSYFVFVSHSASALPALPYLLVPFLLWAALRSGSAGAGSAASIVAFVSVWGAAHGRGPFTEIDPINNVLWLQLFLLSTAVPFMVLAALVEGHKQDEKVLRESEKRFRLVADTAPVLIWMSGVDKMRSFFNKRWLNFTGHAMEKELGEGWTSGVHPDDLPRCLQIYKGSFDARADFDVEYRLRRFDGEYRWIVDYGVPRFESDGQFCGYIGSCVDITDRKSSAEALQALTGRLIHAQEEERTRIARELHDDFSQRMALVGISLGHLGKMLSPSEVEERGKVQEILKETKELSADLHALSHQLHSSKLEYVGLGPAINGLCHEIGHRHKLDIQFSNSGIPGNIPKDVTLCLFRVAQEALINVAKHSQAKSGYVELGANESGVSLRIRDDGKGFDAGSPNPRAGIGLIGMQERIRLVGGRLSVRSAPSQGAEILAEVPWNNSRNETEIKRQAAAK